MSAMRFCVSPLVWLSACALAGCALPETTKTDGSFVTGGSGKYGEPDKSAAERPLSKAGKGLTSKASPRLTLAYADYQAKSNNPGEARRAYELVLASDAKSVDATIGLARLDQVAGRAAEAEQGFLKAVRLNPKSARAHDALGEYYVDQKRWDEALKALEKAQSLDPREPSYRFHYAIALARSGQIEQARTHLVDTVGSAAAHYNIGMILHEQGDLAGAEDEFGTALLEDPRLDQAQVWLNEIRRAQSGGGVRQVSGTVPPRSARAGQKAP